MIDKTPAELLAHVMAATIAMQKFHPDRHAQEAGDIISHGIGHLLAKILGDDAALDMLEECYDILNAGPLKDTGLQVTTGRKLQKDAHSTAESVLAGLRARGLL